MSKLEIIDLSSDEETADANCEIDVKPVILTSIAQDIVRHETANAQSTQAMCAVKVEVPERACMSGQMSAYADEAPTGPVLSGSSVPTCRQFWRSGDYEVKQAAGPTSHGMGRLRIHPKFLHSNATSHKWAFGAIAELLDNAVDEVEKGATYVTVDKFLNPKNGDPALLIQDDGSGMDPESLGHCMSFGFSDKQSGSSIGQYGNGFKTSTMRLGADVIVFSRCKKNRILTQSVGLLSYTFLRETGHDDVVVPMVHYKYNTVTGSWEVLVHEQTQFVANLSVLLKWSPFLTEAELLNQFNDMDQHGTKIIVFNLWLNDDAQMELDFGSDSKDILISGDRNISKKSLENKLTQSYVATRLQYSLRAYASVLYLHVRGNFKIILRGEVVNHHYIAKDLMHPPECILYKPQVAGVNEAAVYTTIGFLEGAPTINVHGFNFYHRNRLILPFWRVAHNSYGKGRGVVGVLEANFIKPTHDKQDFEKSPLFQKLETRMKDMTYEYWDMHCHMVGYTKSKNPSAYLASAPTKQAPNLRYSIRAQDVGTVNGLPRKRKFEREDTCGMEQRQTEMGSREIADGMRSGNSHETQLNCNTGRKRKEEIVVILQENKKLKEECEDYKETNDQLLRKAERLKIQLLEYERLKKNLEIEIKLLEDVKVELS